MVYQLMKGVCPEEMKMADAGTYYADHDNAVYPSTGTGVPLLQPTFNQKDPIADLHENLAAEQKARATYEHLINLADDPDVIDPLRFLREREVVHFQRFGEVLQKVREYLESKKYY